MSLENILHKIRLDAEGQAEALVAEGRAKATAVLARAKAEAEAEAKNHLVRANSEAEEHQARQSTMARLEARKSILATKQGMISRAFTLALEEVRALPIAAARELLRPLVLAAVTEGNEVIVCAKEDKDIWSAEFVRELNATLKAQGLEGTLTLATEHRQTGGGFFLVGPYIEINATYPARLQAMRGDLEPAVAQILFK
ncbi:MAG: V-type ATP synthase subunit E [Peptococcaceae bacterium]|nr:V-type ATP synthase subunit E [Peptococcaceae bacterium]